MIRVSILRTFKSSGPFILVRLPAWDTSRERKSAREALGLSAAAAGQAALRPLGSARA